MAIVLFIYYCWKLTTIYKTENMTVNQNKSIDNETLALAKTNSNIHNVKIVEGQGFIPQTIRINTNDIIVWTNDSKTNQTITSAKPIEWMMEQRLTPSQNFNSNVIQPGKTYTMQFTKLGWFPYYSGKSHGEIKVTN